MIKCFSFGKSLKQLFIIGLISCFTLLVGSSVNADQNFSVGLSSVVNGPAFSGWNFTFQRYGNFLTNNTYRYFIVNTNNNYLFSSSWINGRLYVIVSDGYSNVMNQGFVSDTNFGVGPIDYVGGGCGYQDNECLTADEFYNSTVYNKPDGFAVKNVLYAGADFCFLYSNLSKQVCFYINPDVYHQMSLFTGSLGFSSNPSPADFSSSQLASYVGYSPFNAYGSGMYGTGTIGPTTGNVDNTFTGDYKYLKCTYKVILDQLESSGFSKYLCYGGLDNFDLYNSESTYNPVPGTGKTLGQILAHSSSRAWSPVEWYNFWNGLRGGYTAMWESYPAVYKTWFDIYYQYQGNSLQFESVYEYCILRVSDVDFENTIYNGKYFGFTCDYVKREIINGGGSFNLSGDVIVGVDWSGVGNLSGDKVSDPVVYIQDFFNLLKENFGTRTDSGVGALPTYIILFLMALILFRFISH